METTGEGFLKRYHAHNLVPLAIASFAESVGSCNKILSQLIPNTSLFNSKLGIKMNARMSLLLIVSSLLVSVATHAANQEEELIVPPASDIGVLTNMGLLTERVKAACPSVWEDASVIIDAAVGGEIWSSAQDRTDFDIYLTENGYIPIDGIADDPNVVAEYCARQRVDMVTAIMSNIPDDVLSGMSSISQPEDSADGFLVGDIRMTTRREPAQGWMFLYGQTIGDLGSGADMESPDFKALFLMAGAWYPYDTAWEIPPSETELLDMWNSKQSIILPDTRGRVVAGIDNREYDDRTSRSTRADRMAGTTGNDKQSLSTWHLPKHTHTTSSNGNHTHSIKTVTGPVSGGGGIKRDSSFKGNYWQSGKVSTAGNHRHTVNSAGHGGSIFMLQPTMFLSIELKYTKRVTHTL